MSKITTEFIASLLNNPDVIKSGRFVIKIESIQDGRATFRAVLHISNIPAVNLGTFNMQEGEELTFDMDIPITIKLS